MEYKKNTVHVFSFLYDNKRIYHPLVFLKNLTTRIQVILYQGKLPCTIIYEKHQSYFLHNILFINNKDILKYLNTNSVISSSTNLTRPLLQKEIHHAF